MKSYAKKTLELFSYFLIIGKNWKRRLEIKRMLDRNALSFSSGISIETAFNTLNRIYNILVAEERLTYLRFGDGDVYILNGNSDAKQKISKKIRDEYRDIFAISGDHVIKSLPLHSKKFGCDVGMKIGEHLWPDDFANKILLESFEFFVGAKIWSPVPIHYCMVYHKSLVKKFFTEIRKHRPIFIGGEHNDPNTVAALICQSHFITTPTIDSYEEIDKIYAELVKLIDERCNPYEVILFSCGMSSRVLIKRLNELERKIFLFDLGSVIDIFHNRLEWTWAKKAKLDHKDLCEYLDNPLQSTQGQGVCRQNINSSQRVYQINDSPNVVYI